MILSMLTTALINHWQLDVHHGIPNHSHFLNLSPDTARTATLLRSSTGFLIVVLALGSNFTTAAGAAGAGNMSARP
jgi:hypothetical protein